MAKRHPTKLQTETRYAVVDKVHLEVLSANHRAIGEAFNSFDDWTNNHNLIVVATKKDKILGEVDRRGNLTNSKIALPNIWADRRLARKREQNGISV
jgi:hypothetical protein